MRRYNFGAMILGTLAAAFIATASGDAKSEEIKPYSWIPADQAEFLSSPEYIISVVTSGAPMQVWEALEHGERIECMACISVVAPLMYSENAQNREIAAWWLRRRMVGVFGPGEVYEQTLKTLAGDSNPTNRAYAASAIGEFLLGNGIANVAQALAHDSSPMVRQYAASALGRLNDDGSGALSAAFADSADNVKLAALTAAVRINSFTDGAAAVQALGDGNPLVRRRAAMLLDVMRFADAGGSLASLAQHDGDVEVRVAACHALGNLGNTSANILKVLTSVSTNDSSGLVRDMALIALQEL
jgi:HEAT repeat protein